MPQVGALRTSLSLDKGVQSFPPSLVLSFMMTVFLSVVVKLQFQSLLVSSLLFEPLRIFPVLATAFFKNHFTNAVPSSLC